MEALNTAWVIICALLVLLMQPGFTSLEAGLVGRRNTATIALKNLADLCVCCLVFTAVGSQLMFGATANGIVGRPTFDSMWLYPEQLLYFALLAAVATTVVSGAIAERVGLATYMLVTILVAGLIFPIAGHWIWTEGGVLRTRGFIDAAGSTAIHSVGGWVALALLMAIGPRAGVFDEDSKNRPSSIPTAVMGLLLLWTGWFGITGGSLQGFDERVPGIALATLLAGAAGGAAALLMSIGKGSRGNLATNLMGGVLAGLVSVSAVVGRVEMRSAVIIAAVGGVIYVLGSRLLERLQVDDAVGAVPAHLFAGIWGTLAVALPQPIGVHVSLSKVGPALAIQSAGVLAVGVLAFPISFVAMKLLARFAALRVSEQTERAGIDMIEHGLSDAWTELAQTLEINLEGKNSIRPIAVEQGSETAAFASLYNNVALWLKRSKAEMERLRETTGRDPLTGLYNRATFIDYVEKALAASKRTKKNGAVLFIDLDGFKPVNDHWGHAAGDHVLRDIATRLLSVLRDCDVIARVGGDEFCVLIELLEEDSHAEVVAQKLLDIFDDAVVVNGLQLKLGASIGLATFAPVHFESAGAVIRYADQAMYQAKAQGKGRFCVYQGTRMEAKNSLPPPIISRPSDEPEQTTRAKVAVFPPPDPDDKSETG